MPPRTLSGIRNRYHRRISANILGLRRTRTGAIRKDKRGRPVYNIADGSNLASVGLAASTVGLLGYPICAKPPTPQTAGTLFTEYTLEFIDAALTQITHLIPGDWFLEMRPALAVIAKFDQYEHLDELERLASESEELATTLGSDYLVTPDIVLGRHPFSDADINAAGGFVSSQHLATHTPTRRANERRPILAGSISCKWTMRSDRAQNTRTEANNLIRNRKGQTPHIAAVTFEPLPSRLESIAMGLGEIDCAYHAALHELEKAAAQLGGDEDAQLRRLVSSRRLRDISDLPFDLVA